ncbi:head maturation protease, ClpP-related [Devosia sp. Root105]|uniref:head maturation protease, ClpP-related n=1 Tax=Devosia sp. Root105 TaxID=1736423 RepID=UPI0006F9597B|nr:head maturation protease, ClpP-related [Devosia sp. Root105]KQU95201.1 hypothetical protein ASC68_18795 [Devosia sp. Root105]
MANYLKINPQGAVPSIAFYGTFGEGDLTPEAFSRQWKALNNPRRVDLFISSPGGSVFAANAIADIITRSGAEVTVYVDGLAASMASYIAMLGRRIVMGAGAQFMIHNPAASVGGGSADLTRGASLLEAIRKRMVTVYARRSGQSEEVIARMMDAETWMDAETAVRLGFADEIGADLKMAASAFDLTGRGFRNVPALTTPKSIAELSASYWGERGNAMPAPSDGEEDVSDLIPPPLTNAEAFAAFHGRFAGRKK